MTDRWLADTGSLRGRLARTRPACDDYRHRIPGWRGLPRS
jgi:hypothetical protein